MKIQQRIQITEINKVVIKKNNTNEKKKKKINKITKMIFVNGLWIFFWDMLNFFGF